MISRILGALLMILLVADGGSASDVQAQHGGRAVEASEYHVEMVAKAGVVDGKSQRIVLEPAEGSRLSGKASGELPTAPKGVVQIILPNGKTAQARFN